MSASAPVAPPWHIRVQRVLLRFIGLLIIRTVYRVRTVNADRIPAKGGVLLLPNHVTFTDAFFITAACPRPVRFVMDDRPLEYAAVRWFCSVFNTVNIRKGQSREALRLTVDAVNQGDVVCYFAEGQLARTGALNELKRGIELISGKLEAPLVPLWIDGAWGSVFSFERNVFFRKKPYQLPHRQFAAFGEPIAPADGTVEIIRDRLLKASADAVRLRFPEGTPSEINGHQIGQVNALPWRKPFAVLKGEEVASSLTEGFSEEFGSLAVTRESIGGPVTSWVGGNFTRSRIEASEISAPIDFYDFGSNALEPLTRENVRHFPCLAIDGLVISMSMPDRGGQPGSRTGSWGLLLPGWFVDGNLVKGPAAENGIPLPAGTSVDAGGFVVTESA
ncbi:MAG TPA: 1-acyl-sn-glycerol-3-phosphate acyltransferase [Luteolibacter sp.]|nr:1-acyl-sn-glycerol-3-phosphate acyltransferase [Luteolibacter sp.]